MGDPEVGHLELVEESKRRLVVADETIEVSADEEPRPRFGCGAVARICEITGFEAAPGRLPGVVNTALERTAPQIHVGLKLLVDFCAAFQVVETPVDGQRERAPREGGFIVFPDWTDGD